ncbi:hypothetical protein M9Y10_028065 [Tritrichomonas musculus]|uniref:Ras-GAP domain-containing protein n=1 Tax=Tritrichomonas musculus TaxID=1915356 RepID=A0ABR2KJ46_9EUKA
MSSSKPFIDYSKYAPGVEESVNQINYSEAPKLDDKSLNDKYKALIESLDSTDLNKLLNNPPKILQSFRKLVRDTFSKAGIYATIFDSWPVALVTDSKEVRNLALFIIRLIKGSKNPHNTLQFVSFGCVAPQWHKCSSKKNSILKGCSVITKNSKKFWCYVDVDKYLRIDEIVDKQIRNTTNCRVQTFRVSESGLRFKTADDEKVRCQLDNPSMSEVWKQYSETPFPLFLGSYTGPVPKAVLTATLEAINSDDNFLIRILTSPSIVKINDGVKNMTDLFNIACYSGRINQLYTTLVAEEFENEDLKPESVLRSNTHLTNLVKVLVSKYCTKYVTNFASKLVTYILKSGNLNLGSIDNCEDKKVEKVLFTSLKYILRSAPLIPPQIKHFGSILRSAASTRFNDIEAVQNTLSGFFILRFITAIIADPKKYDSTIEVSEDDVRNILAPFSHLLQKPLSFSLIEGKAKFVKKWNTRIEKHIFPKLKTFIFTLTEISSSDSLIYLPPEGKNVKRALDNILKTLNQNYPIYADTYKKLLDAEDEPRPIVGWDFAAFFSGFFKYNI